MPVITLNSPKGGVGKTTTAVILATELAAMGESVVLIDADPNKPLESWSQLSGDIDLVEVLVELEEDEIINTIDQARRRASWVIVDLEGKATARATNALLMSDLALVPMQGSSLDATEGAKAFKAIRNAAIARGRPLPFAAVLTRTPATERVWSRDLKALVEELGKGQVPVVRTALAERGAFRGIFSVGGTLASLDPKLVSSLDSAKLNARSFAKDVVRMIEESR